MCARFVSVESSGVIASYFGAQPSLDDELDGWQPRYNIAPTQMVRVVARHSDQTDSKIEVMRWGLQPQWLRPGVRTAPLINARRETVANKPSFRDAYVRRRCIVAMTGFYEWTEGDSDGTRTTSGRLKKQPYLFTPLTYPMLAVAGIWHHAVDGSPASVAILTTAANSDMADLHDRMPVLLDPEHWEQWTDPTLHDLGIIGSLGGSVREGQLMVQRVSTDMNSVRAEGPHLLSRVQEPGFVSGSHDFGSSQAPQLFPDQFST